MTEKEKNRLDLLEGQLKVQGDSIREIQADIVRIKSYMENDDMTNQKGMVERLEILQNTVNDLIKREEVYKGKATVWGIVGSVIWSGVVAAFWFIIKNVL